MTNFCGRPLWMAPNLHRREVCNFLTSFVFIVLSSMLLTDCTCRGIKSARQERVDAPLTQQDRSKSVPSEVTPSRRFKAAVSFLSGMWQVLPRLIIMILTTTDRWKLDDLKILIILNSTLIANL